MIPKKIHYVWVGNGEMSDLNLSCIESWKKYFPDYEIIKWDETNIPLQNDYIKNALKNKKWSNLSNYIRIYSLYEYGGIYFDTDFEVIKRFDFLNDVTIFCGFEDDRPLVNSAVLGSHQGELFLKECLQYLTQKFDGLESSNLSGPELITEVLKIHGLKSITQNQLNNISIFPITFFYPYPWNKNFTFSSITPKTYGIHHWEKTWVFDDVIEENKNLKNKLLQHDKESNSIFLMISNLFKIIFKRLKIKV